MSGPGKVVLARPLIVAVWGLLVEGLHDLGGAVFVFGVGVGVGRDLDFLCGHGQGEFLPAGDVVEGREEFAGGGFGGHEVFGVAPVLALLEQADAVVVGAFAFGGVF